MKTHIALAALMAVGLAACEAQDAETDQAAPEAPSSEISSTAKPITVAGSCPDNVYWGDTHLHTLNSGDAIFNSVRLTPEDAFRFAKGEEVRSSSGLTAKLARPLDFLLVSDHAEGLGIGKEMLAANPEFMKDPTLKRWIEMMNGTPEEAALATRELVAAFAANEVPEAMNDPKIAGPMLVSTWREYLKAAERYNEPGTFSTLIGYEYTSLVEGNNLHRVVMFRDSPDVIGDTLPYSSTTSPDPEDLWAYMAAYEEKTGGRVLAIPHNSNVSNGMMFDLVDYEGNPFTKDYADRRARWEPVVEATQIKGDSEAHPVLSPDDEFADFGNIGWDQGNLTMMHATTDEMQGGNYVREALKRGLAFEAELGTNPYKFGLIGATDSHTALATGDEDNFLGKFSTEEEGADRPNLDIGAVGSSRVGWQYLAGGYAGVWAPANERTAIFDAFANREVYATTGPRMVVRMFAGWDLSQGDLALDPCALYEKAVPMGGELSAPEGDAPKFLVTALKDPDGANLDRVQMVKGWLDSDGQLREKVYDISWSDGATRRPDENGKLPPVGNTVDLTTATYENSIGAPQLLAIWTDPDFDAAERAFYYVRVLEIPTPRWIVFDAVRYGAEITEDMVPIAQERVYTSPVWYSPAS